MRSIVIVSALIVSACLGRAVPSMETAQSNAALSESRLDQYDRAYSRSGHPKVGPAEILTGMGRGPFDLIIARIESLEDFDRYIRVIYEMDRSGDIDICSADNMNTLVSKVKTIGGLPSTPYPVRFLNCYMPMSAYKE